jgi:hypothetical protein
MGVCVSQTTHAGRARISRQFQHARESRITGRARLRVVAVRHKSQGLTDTGRAARAMVICIGNGADFEQFETCVDLRRVENEHSEQSILTGLGALHRTYCRGRMEMD